MMKNFFTCHLMGGIGNQMFQIANTISKGLEYNKDCFFRKNSFTPMQGRDTSNYLTNIFRKLNFSNDLSYDLRINEIDWSYNPLIVPENKSIEFYGYFQSSKNFKEYEKEIRELFEPNLEFIEEAYSKYPELKLNNTLSIHVRRGDCFQNPDIHPIANEKYFNRALKLIGEYSHVFIFSDDKEWVKNNLNLSNSTFIEEDEDYKEIWLMSLCKNNIIVNSTFSWWGSFLNKNKNKKVIAPSIWFGPRGPKNYKDIYESYWEIIEVKYENGWLI